MPVIVQRTPWRERLIWNTWRYPLPYLFDRWDAWAIPGPGFWLDGWCSGFWRRSSAQRYADFVNDGLL
jgi:hypothetical protein